MAIQDLGTIPMDTVDETIIDPGAPLTHDREQPEQKQAPAKSDSDRRLEALEKDLENERKARREADETARYWANRNKQPAPAADDDEEPKPRRRQAAEVEVPKDADGVLLEELNADGLAALKKRGVITADQLDAALENLASRIETAYANEREGDAFDQNMQKEFPELFEDNKRVDAGDRPQTELYHRTAKHFKQLTREAGIKPESVAARGMMLAAARMAKQEIKMEGLTDNHAEDDRRERIERQRSTASRGTRSGEGEVTSRGPRELTPTQQTIVNNLKRYGATPEGFQKFAKGGTHGR